MTGNVTSVEMEFSAQQTANIADRCSGTPGSVLHKVRSTILRCLIGGIAVMSLGGLTGAAHAQSKAPPPGPRIDVPVADATGVRLDFGGAVLRVPQFMVESRLWPSNRREALKVQRFGFTFWYPSMEQSYLIGPKRILPPDRVIAGSTRSVFIHPLVIYVAGLVYSPDGSPANREPRPSDILANEGGPPEISPSPYPGLRSGSYLAASLKEFPGLRNHMPSPSTVGRLYIQTIDSPYELYMVCHVSATGSCTANVYSKVHHFSMQITLYGNDAEVAPQADQIFRTLNHLVDSWISK
jgi:hypothetical protein